MRTLLLVGCAALALSACGDNDSSEANNVAADNMMMDQNAALGDPTMDPNMTGNMPVDSATQNMMMNDMNTNDPDTNLANGM